MSSTSLERQDSEDSSYYDAESEANSNDDVLSEMGDLALTEEDDLVDLAPTARGMVIIGGSPAGLSSSRIPKCLRESEIPSLYEAELAKFADLTSLPPEVCLQILVAMSWDTEKSINSFLEKENFLTELGIDGAAHDPSNVYATEPFECCVCIDSFEGKGDDGVMLPCSHACCSACLASYINIKMAERKSLIACPSCRAFIPHSVLLSFLSDENKPVMGEAVVRSYVGSQPTRLKWCPTPRCQSLVMVSYDLGSMKSVVCTNCTKAFCYRCGSNHAPASCEMAKNFALLVDQQGDTVAFLTTHTKDCPNCTTPIEKNGGCNWIMCSHCKFEFCWLCLRHMLHKEVDAAGGNHKCNVFKEGEEKEIAKRAEKSQALRGDRVKFAHHFSRYQDHSESHKLQQVFFKKLLKLTARCEIDKPFLDALLGACGLLDGARSALINSYVLGFYKQWNPATSEKMIFEDLQHLLESRTEALAAAVERFNHPDAFTRVSPHVVQDFMRCRDAVRVNLTNLLDICFNDTSSEN